MAYPVPMWAGVSKEAAPSGPPTGVSIATSSSGNYDDATQGSDISGCGFTAMDFGGAGWASNALTTYPDVNEFSAFDGCSAQSALAIYGYIRESGATSFQWDLTLVSQSLSNGCIAQVVGTASTSQDATGSGIGEYCRINFGGGRGGQLYPLNGDSLVLDIEADATNGSGTTSATKCVLTYDFI